MTKRERFYFKWRKYLKKQQLEDSAFMGLMCMIKNKGIPVMYNQLDVNHIKKVYAMIMSVPAPKAYY